MRKIVRFRMVGVAVGLGLIAAIVTGLGLSSAIAAGSVDLTLDMQAPAHVAAGSTIVVRTAFFNFGTVSPPNAWVTATLPAGTHYVTSTNRWDTPLPPDTIDGNELSWYFDNLSCHAPLDANCGHILITMEVDEELPEQEALTTTTIISTSAVESDTSNNTASVTSVICDMAGSGKQVQAQQVMPGDVLTYTIAISRAHRLGGAASARWVTLTDTLPFSHQVRFLGWNGTVTGTQIEGHKLQWEGQVRAGQPFTLQYRMGVEGDVAPGTVISNAAGLAWGDQHMPLGPVTTVVTLPHNMLALGANQGGHLYHQHGVTLSVPAGAVSDTTRFQLGPLFTDTHSIPSPRGLLFAHRAFELSAFRFGQDVHQFDRPLTITVDFTDTDVMGLKLETLQLWTRSGPQGPWAMLGEPARVMSRTMAFTTTHFSQFALFGEPRNRAFLPVIAH